MAGSSSGICGYADRPTGSSRPALITLEREGYDDQPRGYLLGMILIAPFCDACGVADDAP